MKALLINPTIPETFWSFKYALSFIRKKAAYPSLGLLTLAALMPKTWEKRLVDTNVQTLNDADLAWADMVFIGGMTVQRDSAHQIIDRCKRAGLKVVAGGPLFTSEPQNFPQVDHLVLNEAEITLPLFLADLDAGRPQPCYESREFADITATPAPAWELLDLRRYATMSVQFSRGCPFDCDFCNVTSLFGHRPRTKTPAQLIAEMDSLYRRGWRRAIFIVDDNFIGNKKAVRELLPLLIKWQEGKRLPLLTQVSINLADDDRVMEMMAKSQFDTVFIGIETPDDQSLSECDKRQNLHRDLVRDVQRIHHAGLQVQAGFIVGFDHDTSSIFQRQIDFIQKSGIVTAMVGQLQAIPGTRLYQRMEHDGRLVGTSTGDNVDGTTNILTRMDRGELRRGHEQIMKQIYSPKLYYQRIKTFLLEYRSTVRQAPPSMSQVMAFLRSTVRLGVVSRGRFHYWKLLLWTAARRRRQFPLAITLWIYGHHFRKVARDQLGG